MFRFLPPSVRKDLARSNYDHCSSRVYTARYLFRYARSSRSAFIDFSQEVPIASAFTRHAKFLAAPSRVLPIDSHARPPTKSRSRGRPYTLCLSYQSFTLVSPLFYRESQRKFPQRAASSLSSFHGAAASPFRFVGKACRKKSREETIARLSLDAKGETRPVS